MNQIAKAVTTVCILSMLALPAITRAQGVAQDTALQEEIKRQANEQKGLESIQSATELMKAGQYQESEERFVEGLTLLTDRPAMDAVRLDASDKLEKTRMSLVDELIRDNNYGAAKAVISRVLDENPANTKALAMRQKIDKSVVRSQTKAKEDAVQAALNKEKDTIQNLIKDGRRMISMEDYDAAELKFEQVLARDPYNRQAMQYLNSIEERRFKVSTINRKTTTADMVQDVRDAWNPPMTISVQMPSEGREGQMLDTATGTQLLQEKMADIVIPSLEFRQANIVDVVNFLRDASAASDPDGMGINILLNLGVGEEEESVEDNMTSDLNEDFGFQETKKSSLPNITLTLRNVTLLDAVKYITEIAGLRYRLEDRVVIITRADVAVGQIMTRLYPVQPSFMDILIERDTSSSAGGNDFTRMGQDSTSVKKSDVKEYFERMGVAFPGGASITYNAGISQLIVANTADNLEVFERILAQLNIIPNQVEIEARFVEINQEDLAELGFQWLLNDDWELATKSGAGSIGSSQRIQVDANGDSGGFSRGLRFFDSSSAGTLPSAASSANNLVGNILSLSGILTNPELGMVLHALDQKGGSDMLSAPRVTTRSGVNAQIQVVEEIIYPTEFDAQLESVDGGEGEADTQRIVVTPGSFETREVGVILNVTPTVGPDGYTIDLTMLPEVVELSDWLNYGYTAADDSAVNIFQPIFSKRSVSTSIVIWDGQTVVMGGLIKEELTSVDDKIPLLGDIPVLGRLFRNKGEFSQKKNLMIFVTARLVDPAGKVINRADARTLGGS